MKGVSIIITAWHTEKYIESCLDSIQKQTYFKTHKNYEILLGIDSCETTLDKVKKIREKYKNLEVYYFDKNVGTYIVSNTLCNIAKYDYLIRFDSDDIMMDSMIEKMVNYANKNGCEFFTSMAKIMGSNTKVVTIGQIFITKKLFDKFGGFRPFPCAMDKELSIRLKPFIKISYLPEALFQYRQRQDSLTKNKSTGMNSSFRYNLHKFINWEVKYLKGKSEEYAIINCVTENPRKLLEDNTLSDVIEVTTEKRNIEDLYEIWKKSSDYSRGDFHENSYSRYPIIRAQSGYNVFY